ncbi:patatin-like phospholipase family protein [Parendozoicomonas haliclonae]|uniref:Patatin-like phospholipase n=1 Tax=Parendozoicomonas haliclonae TaxID=1960125 RepID=A0A1X7AN89_9GAMM|nr:patatin-like phospholipase family protein [Parendozoicomonas haliclonae]SMA49781.1 hypothetical protein EHSB41UT_03570 [Parendozoicomonas haliclonae]
MAIKRSLVVRGGRDALAHIKSQGFQQQDVKAMLGASGGPKWFVLSGMDRALLGTTFKDRTEPLALLGSSAGCWRFACYGMNDPVAAINRFQEAYIRDKYDARPTPEQVSANIVGILNHVFGEHGAQEIIANPVRHLNLIAVQGHGPMASEKRPVQMAGLLAASLGNAVSRRLLAPLFSRIVFEHPLGHLPVGEMSDLPTRRVKLDTDNVAAAIQASGSIPLVLAGVEDIPGAGPGMYRDGGVTDYHFDLPLTVDEGLVLYPHFREQPIPGWFDKGLPWRKPSAENYRRTLLVAPSPEFVASLPYGKIPDRNDFTNLDTETRQKYWNKAVAESDRMGDEWLELVEKQQLADVIEPLTF